MPDRVPFTIKRPQPPQGEIERRLRNEGMAICIEELPFTTTGPMWKSYGVRPLKMQPCFDEIFRTQPGSQPDLGIRPGYGSAISRF
jgi:hypothetical protein